MSDTEVRVNQAVSAVVVKAMAAILVPALLGFWGWVGLTLENQGELLAQVKTVVDQTRGEIVSVRRTVDEDRADINGRIGQIMDVAATEKTETERLKQALADHEARDDELRGKPVVKPRGN